MPYRIVDGHKTVLTRSAARSPRLIAEQAGVDVYPQDNVELQPVNNMAEAGTVGQDIVIDRATVVTVVVDGQELELRSQGSTVGELLKDNDIDVTDSDAVHPGVTTKLKPGLRISVARVRINVETVDETIEREVEEIADTNQPRNYRKVKTEGSNGVRQVSYLVTYSNGQVASKKEIKSQITVAPVARVEIVGTKTASNRATDSAFAALRQCEAGGNYARNSGNGYYGAYQYDLSTWSNYQGYARPDLAPPAVQDAKARETQARRGWSPWPACARKLGLI